MWCFRVDSLPQHRRYEWMQSTMKKIESCQVVYEPYHCRLKKALVFSSFLHRFFKESTLTTSSGCTGLMKYGKSDILNETSCQLGGTTTRGRVTVESQ